MTRSVLIFGASGHSGRALASAFEAGGWAVRPFVRGRDVSQVARGVDLIVNAMNPPNYHDWARQIPAITALVMQAARVSGARVVIPGNVYVYGGQPGPWGPQTPHRPCSRKGQIRAEMEAAWRSSGLPVTILHSGDFLDDTSTVLTMQRVVMQHIRKGWLTTLRRADVPRAYAYLPDFARATVALCERSDMPRFVDLSFAGHSFSIDDLAAEIGRQTGQVPRVRSFPWWIMGALSPVWELARELREMRYLFDLPHAMDGDTLAELVPGLPETPFAEVVARHLAAMGVSPAAP